MLSLLVWVGIFGLVVFSSGEEREARAVFSWEISNLESAALFAFSSSAALQVRQQKAERKIYAPIC